MSQPINTNCAVIIEAWALEKHWSEPSVHTWYRSHRWTGDPYAQLRTQGQFWLPFTAKHTCWSPILLTQWFWSGYASVSKNRVGPSASHRSEKRRKKERPFWKALNLSLYLLNLYFPPKVPFCTGWKRISSHYFHFLCPLGRHLLETNWIFCPWIERHGVEWVKVWRQDGVKKPC